MYVTPLTLVIMNICLDLHLDHPSGVDLRNGLNPYSVRYG